MMKRTYQVDVPVEVYGAFDRYIVKGESKKEALQLVKELITLNAGGASNLKFKHDAYVEQNGDFIVKVLKSKGFE